MLMHCTGGNEKQRSEKKKKISIFLSSFFVQNMTKGKLESFSIGVRKKSAFEKKKEELEKKKKEEEEETSKIYDEFLKDFAEKKKSASGSHIKHSFVRGGEAFNNSQGFESRHKSAPQDNGIFQDEMKKTKRTQPTEAFFKSDGDDDDNEEEDQSSRFRKSNPKSSALAALLPPAPTAAATTTTASSSSSSSSNKSTEKKANPLEVFFEEIKQ